MGKGALDPFLGLKGWVSERSVRKRHSFLRLHLLSPRACVCRGRGAPERCPSSFSPGHIFPLPSSLARVPGEIGSPAGGLASLPIPLPGSVWETFQKAEGGHGFHSPGTYCQPKRSPPEQSLSTRAPGFISQDSSQSISLLPAGQKVLSPWGWAGRALPQEESLIESERRKGQTCQF